MTPRKAISLRLCGLVSLSLAALCYGFVNTSDEWEGTVETSGASATMHTNAIRCLASLLYTLSKQYHVHTTYEDAPLEFAADMIDITAGSYRFTSSNHVFIPRGGPLAFRFSINPSDQLPSDAKQAISSLLEAYRTSAYPGEYALIESGAAFHVVPSATRDIDGQRKSVAPLMGSQVTLHHQEAATVAAAIRAVLMAASRNSGREIVLGAPLPQQFETIPFTKDLENVTAREGLEQAIATGAVQMSWLLLYDPTFKYYVFSAYEM